MPLSAEHRDWLTLALVPGVGTASFIRLLARFHTPKQVLDARRPDLEAVVGPSLAQRIHQYADAANAHDQEKKIDACGVTLVTLSDPAYPQRLAEIYDPPLLLFVRGTLLEQDAYSVAIVGTRRATPYGMRMAGLFGRELASRGITVISGLAQGIDAAAHRGALEAGGRTIAVLGCGVDVVYPAQHKELLEAVAQQGCVLSQFPMGAKPSRGNFPYRNRIISGMSMGTLVVEAPLRSGALITARQAAEQGREVFAVPGQAGVEASQGPHALIRDGAKLAETVQDILAELNLPASFRGAAFSIPPLPEATTAANYPDARRPMQSRTTRAASTAPPGRSPAPEEGASQRGARAQAPEQPARTPVAPAPALSPTPPSKTEQTVLSSLSPDGSLIDEIALACRMSVAEALSTLTMLELKGLVRQFSGKRFAPR